MNLIEQFEQKLEQMKSDGKKVVSIEFVENQLYGLKHHSNPIPFVNSHQVHSEGQKHSKTP